MNNEMVKDWMTRSPVCATLHTTLPEAHQWMKTRGIHRLPVLDDHGNLVGIVTLGDLRGAQPSEATSLSIFELNYLLSKITVERIMTANPITVAPDVPVREAAKLMLKNKIAGLPVVDGNKVVGVITESDIFRMVVRNWIEAPAAV